MNYDGQPSAASSEASARVPAGEPSGTNTVSPARPKLGLALAAGGARGSAHSGVLRVFAEHGIDFDVVAGASIGSIVGAAYAAGIPAEAVEREWVSTDAMRMTRLFMPTLSRSGLTSGAEKRRIVLHVLGEDRLIEELRIPFAAVACDIDTGEEVVLRTGSLVDAVSASAAIPGIFRPERVDGRLLVDGGLVNPLPVTLCREMGADIVVAVDIVPAPRATTAYGLHLWDNLGEKVHDLFEQSVRIPGTLGELFDHLRERERHKSMPGLYAVISQALTIFQQRILALQLAADPPDVLIRPRVEFTSINYLRAADGIAAGRTAAQNALPQLRQICPHQPRASLSSGTNRDSYSSPSVEARS
ncbi:patatin-like phospholipase family protein [Candidatus Bipolaricaulota bacterium]|nr:patatin-like phospholipase family protein [Candidatus Bipolaricaulota bacterium]